MARSGGFLDPVAIDVPRLAHRKTGAIAGRFAADLEAVAAVQRRQLDHCGKRQQCPQFESFDRRSNDRRPGPEQPRAQHGSRPNARATLMATTCDSTAKCLQPIELLHDEKPFLGDWEYVKFEI